MRLKWPENAEIVPLIQLSEVALLFLLCYAVNSFSFPLELSVCALSLDCCPLGCQVSLGWVKKMARVLINPELAEPRKHSSEGCPVADACHISSPLLSFSAPPVSLCSGTSQPPVLPSYCSLSSLRVGGPSPPTRHGGHWGHVVEDAACHKNSIECFCHVGWTP